MASYLTTLVMKLIATMDHTHEKSQAAARQRNAGYFTAKI